ncbi:metal-sensitive transcriptional regulator [Streptomyces sp. AVP053U2]|uniref:metal-sensitive transcriptional regulator n=1 Tax=Streptomyces sp. AVP053U2 TaxID=1737066 RepID=UPI00073B9699|nr:metal-sensitive transcriptional regulator [Streptomyces sp. AVP053U2]ODA75462.1 Copper-sensing transcriptional repressor CsoR [Streptomyces sp. AVP053U2]
MTTTEAGADAPSSPDATDGTDVTEVTAATGTKDAPTAPHVIDSTAPAPTGTAGAAGTAGTAGIVTDHDRGIHGYHHEKQEHLKRLRRIEGQIRGLQRMVDEDVYCIDILTQVSASTKALQSFALQLLEEHLRHCVADAALKGGDEIDAKVKEATQAIARMLRT